MKQSHQKAAFTLVELLGVLAIIIILAGLLLPAISKTRTRALVVAAETEARQIETAWLQYLSEYQVWPSNMVDGEKFAITNGLARILAGEDVDGRNPKRIPFMRFGRCDSSGNPVNPWGSRTSPSSNDWYYCRFDTDYDNVITGAPPNEPSSDIRRQVIVWTYNQDASSNDLKRIIRSWIK